MALREVRDDAGVLWTIYDVHPNTKRHSVPQVRAELTAGWLCFQSDREKRRCAGVPAAWEQLDDHALTALLATAMAVAPPRGHPA